MAHRGQLWGVFAGAFLALSACGAPAPISAPYGFTFVSAQDRTQGGPVIPSDVLERTLQEQLSSSSMFSGPESGGLAVEVFVKILEDDRGRPVLRLHLAMEPPPGQKTLLRDGLSATVQVEPASQNVDPQADLVFAARRAVAVLEARVLLATLEPANVATVLRVSDEEILSVGLEFVREHRAAGVADEVVALLHHPSDEVAGLAVEALGVVGRRENVDAILGGVRLGDRRHTFALYEALGSLGGESAEAFLDFAARNEDDPQLAVAAERALGHAKSPGRVSTLAPTDQGGTIARGHR